MSTLLKNINFDLFTLVKSMDKGEKRFFKMYAANKDNEKNNRFVDLFDIIDNLSDHKKINKNKFAFFSVKQLYNAQFYLYHFILKCLRAYESGDTIEIKLKKILIEVDVLLKKKLQGQCFKLLNKAERMAKQYEKNIYLMMIWFKYYDIYSSSNITDIYNATLANKNQKKITKKLMGIKTEVDLTIEQLHFISEHLSDKKKLSDESEVKKYFSSITRSRIYNIEAKGHTHEVQILHNYIHEQVHMRQGEHSIGANYISRNIQLLDKNDSLLIDSPDMYMVFLYNYINHLIKETKYNEALQWVNKTNKIIEIVQRKKDKTTLSQLRLNKEVYNTLIYIKQGDFGKVSECDKQLGNIILNWESSLYSLLVIYGCFCLAVLNFANNNFRKSLKWLEHIMDEYGPSENPIFQFHARMLTIIIQHEIGNDMLVDTMFENSKDYIIRYMEEKKYLLTFLELLRELFNENNSHIRNRILKDITKIILNEDQLKKDFFNAGFFYAAWARSVQLKVSFKQAYGQLL